MVLALGSWVQHYAHLSQIHRIGDLPLYTTFAPQRSISFSGKIPCATNPLLSYVALQKLLALNSSIAQGMHVSEYIRLLHLYRQQSSNVWWSLLFPSKFPLGLSFFVVQVHAECHGAEASFFHNFMPSIAIHLSSVQRNLCCINGHALPSQENQNWRPLECPIRSSSLMYPMMKDLKSRTSSINPKMNGSLSTSMYDIINHGMVG